MTFARLCSADFHPTTKQRGEEYLESGRVQDLQVDEDMASAIVEGDAGNYTVELDFSHRRSGGLCATCTCPNYRDGFFCKHIWAVLLAMDRQCQIRMLDGNHIVLIHLSGLDESGEPYAELFPSRKSSYRLLGANNGEPRSGGNWKRVLRHLATDEEYLNATDPAREANRRGKATSIAGNELWYVLNVAESQSSGQLTIELFQRQPLKRGGWRKAKRLSLRRDAIESVVGAEDRAILSLLFGNEVVEENQRGYGYQYSNTVNAAGSRCHLMPGMHEFVLPRLAATQRFVWLLDSSMPVEEGKPVDWDDGPAWGCQLQMVSDDAAKQWRISAEFFRGDEKRPLKEAVLLIPNQLVLFRDTLARSEVNAEVPWIRMLLKHGPILIPFADRAAWLADVLSLPSLPKVELPKDLDVQRVSVQPQPRLEIMSPEKRAYGMNDDLLGDVQFIYGEARFARTDNNAGMFDESTNQFLVRDRKREGELVARLFELGCRQSPYYTAPESNYLVVPLRQLSMLVRVLVSENWVVETQGIRTRRPGEFKLDVTTGVDWFELDGKIDFDGVSVTLPALLAAVRKNEVFIRLDDGTQGILPEEWLNKYGRLVQLADVQGDKLRFNANQGLLLDALLAEQSNVAVDQGFSEFRDKVRSFSGVTPATPPTSFCGELRNYQKDGLGWLHFLRDFQFGGCLADDMGLGKTVQVLALLETRRTRDLKKDEARLPSLVIVPKSLVFNWIDEAARFAPQLRILNFTGGERGDAYLHTSEYDLLITTYGTLRRDVVKLKNVQFDYAILDESQAIKNADSQAAKACRLVKANHRLAMTGTPVENHLGELWSLFDFLNPAMLGKASAFTAFARTNREHDAESLQVLARALRPFLLRRTKAQVLSELPEKTEQTLYCELSDSERKAYDELRDYYRLQLSNTVREKGLAKSKIHVLEALLRLRQAACHPGLLDKTQTGELSAKLETLLEQIEEIIDEGHKALVFSQFTSLLAIVRSHLDRQGFVYEYLDGQTGNRGERVKRFQEDPECPLFLISLKAGGHGLNLTAADYVFILDPWWNPAVEAQAVDRAHRIGQTRRVFAYRLIARNTVEDKILELQKSKRDLADAIVSANNSVIRTLTSEDLELLLS
jgi:superfamily II DNA or RNA helicase